MHLSTDELALLFTDARTHSAWPDPAEDATLQRIYELARWPPTGSNGQTMRAVFVKSPAAKEQLRPALAPMNVEKTMTAAVTALIAYDVSWPARMTHLSGRPDASERFAALLRKKIARYDS